MTAASPGHRRVRDGEPALPVDARSTCSAVAAALRTEYRFIVEQRAAAADRRARPRDGTPHAVRRPAARRVPRLGRARRRRHQRRARRHRPGDVRLHVCWGNYEGPHTLDVPLDESSPLLYEAEVGALVLSMANARHAHEHRCFERQPLPDGMVLVAGRHRHDEQLRRAPGGRRRPARARRRAPSATPGGSSPAPTAASTRRPASATSRRRSCGRSCAPCARAPTSPARGCSAERTTGAWPAINGAPIWSTMGARRPSPSPSRR